MNRLVMKDAKMNPILFYVGTWGIAICLVIIPGAIIIPNLFPSTVHYGVVFVLAVFSWIIIKWNSEMLSFYKSEINFDDGIIIAGEDSYCTQDIEALIVFSNDVLTWIGNLNPSYKVKTVAPHVFYRKDAHKTDFLVLRLTFVLLCRMNDGTMVVLRRGKAPELMKLRRRIYDELGNENIKGNQVFPTGSKYNEIDPK